MGKVPLDPLHVKELNKEGLCPKAVSPKNEGFGGIIKPMSGGYYFQSAKPDSQKLCQS